MKKPGPTKHARAVVLLSGGMGSTVALWLAKRDHADELHALHFSTHISPEAQAADHIAHMAGVASSTMVTLPKLVFDRGAEHARVGHHHAFLTLAAIHAVHVGASLIVVGDHYPDPHDPRDTGSRDFLDVVGAAVNLSLPDALRPMEIRSPVIGYVPSTLVRLASDISPACAHAVGLSVSCELGQQRGCGSCASCEARARAFEIAGMIDPSIPVGLVAGFKEPKLPV